MDVGRQRGAADVNSKRSQYAVLRLARVAARGRLDDGVRVRLAGRPPQFAALDLYRAAEAVAGLASAMPPKLSRKQRAIVRPRFAGMVKETRALIPHIVDAVHAMHAAFWAASPIREAAGERPGDFDAAIEAMSGQQLRTALSAMYADLYQQGIALVRLEIPDAFDLPPTRAMQRLDKYALTFSTDVADSQKKWLKTTIREALADGLDLGKLKREIAIYFEEGVHRTDANGAEHTVDVDSWAMQVARTETARAQNQGAMDAYKAAQVDYLVWISADDERRCIICAGADRTVAAIGEKFESTDVSAPPAHVNCFPAGTMVATEAVWNAATVRDFVGDLIRIRLANGLELTATPNHPIATRRGWVPISQLDRFDDVLYRAGAESALPDPNDKHVESLIEQVADSFAVTLATVPAAAEDFHGDGSGSDVYVIRTRSELRDGRDSNRTQSLRKLNLVMRCVRPAALDTLGSPRAMFGTLLTSANSIMCRARSRCTRFWRGICGLGAIRFTAPAYAHSVLQQTSADASATDVETSGKREFALSGRISRSDGGVIEGHPVAAYGDTPFSQATGNGSDADSEGFCERIGALPGFIASGNVVVWERLPASAAAQVYNLESANGWFFANGIVAHNCRCTTVAYSELTMDLVAPQDRPKDALVA